MIRLAIEASQKEEEERLKQAFKMEEQAELARKNSEVTAKEEQLRVMQVAAAEE